MSIANLNKVELGLELTFRGVCGKIGTDNQSVFAPFYCKIQDFKANKSYQLWQLLPTKMVTESCS